MYVRHRSRRGTSGERIKIISRRGTFPVRWLGIVVLSQQPTQMRDIARRQPQRVQLRELRIGRHPRQRRLETCEGAAEHSHAGSLSLVGGVSRGSVGGLSAVGARSQLGQRRVHLRAGDVVADPLPFPAHVRHVTRKYRANRLTDTAGWTCYTVQRQTCVQRYTGAIISLSLSLFSASDVTILWRYTNMLIIIIILSLFVIAIATVYCNYYFF